MTTVTDPIDVALLVASVLERCGIRYLVGGSLASSASGEPRSTLDVDMVVELTKDRVPPFLEALGDGFYADEGALERAVGSRGSTNIIHLATSTKVDLFVLGGTPLDEQQMARRVLLQVGADPDRRLYTYTPEDILLQKLRWYRRGNEVSDRQWRDIRGILVVQAERLDRRYLREGAETLGVSDLLDRALKETVR